MTPASKNEFAKITECDTRIKHLEKDLKELKEDFKSHIKEETETKRYVSNKRLAIYLAIASIFGGIITATVIKLLDLLVV